MISHNALRPCTIEPRTKMLRAPRARIDKFANLSVVVRFGYTVTRGEEGEWTYRFAVTSIHRPKKRGLVSAVFSRLEIPEKKSKGSGVDETK